MASGAFAVIPCSSPPRRRGTTDQARPTLQPSHPPLAISFSLVWQVLQLAMAHECTLLLGWSVCEIARQVRFMVGQTNYHRPTHVGMQTLNTPFRSRISALKKKTPLPAAWAAWGFPSPAADPAPGFVHARSWLPAMVCVPLACESS
jgi:hypothetical protein